MKQYFIILAALFTSHCIAYGQSNPKDAGLKQISEQTIAAQLEFLASDWMEGRETGTKGAYMSADYIASMFKEIGLEPGGDQAPVIVRRTRNSQTVDTDRKRSYFQNFNLIETKSTQEQKFGLVDRNGGGYAITWLNPGVDFNLTGGQQSVDIEAPLVFIGYGINKPELGYNDFKNIDVKGKVLLRLSGYPGHRDPESKGYAKFAMTDPLEANRLERGKDAWASEAGALAIIDIYPGMSIRPGTPSNIPFRYNEANWEGEEPFRNTPRVRLSRPTNNTGNAMGRILLDDKFVTQILRQAGIDTEQFEATAASNLKTGSSLLNNQFVRMVNIVETRLIQARNVIGFIQGKNPDQCIVVGAHYDHVGMTRGFIYNGSDDNASGTVGIMTIARAIKASGIQPEVTLIFCAWTAEEKGLIGSAHYADNPLIADIKAYMNYDMISRVALDDPTKSKCDYNFSSGKPIFKELAERHIKEYNLNLDMAYQSSERPRGGSDFSSFSAKGIPIFLIHGKFTPDYHQYTDHFEKADLPYMTDIVKLGYLNIFELATTTKW